MSRNHRSPTSPRPPRLPPFQKKTRRGYQIFFPFFLFFLFPVYTGSRSQEYGEPLSNSITAVSRRREGRDRVDGEVVKMAVARSRK